MNSKFRWWLTFFLWLSAFSVLTWKLLDPKPIPPGLEPPINLFYVLAKSFHVGFYSLVTLLGLLLSRSWKWRFGYLAFMIWHAIGTEIGQSFIPTRRGSVNDVAFDYLGITIGWLMIVFWERWKTRSL